MEPLEFEGVSGIMRSSNPFDELGDISKGAESALQEAQAMFDLDEHIRKIVREELERWERQLVNRWRIGTTL